MGHVSNAMMVATRNSILRQAQCYRQPLKVFNTTRPSAFARLLSSLAVLEQREGKLNHASLSAVTAAQRLGGPITGLVAGSNVRSVAEEAAKVKGLEQVIMISNSSYDKVCME